MDAEQKSPSTINLVTRLPRLASLAEQLASTHRVAPPDARALVAKAIEDEGVSAFECARRHHPFSSDIRKKYGMGPERRDQDPWKLTKEQFAEAGFAIRHGEIQSTGAYFATPGWSTYYDGDSERVSGHRYDLAALQIADPGKTEVGLAILARALEHPDLTTAKIERLRELINEYDENEGVINYMDNDSLPLPWAAKQLGWDGILVWENDDAWSASSVFVWAVDRVDYVCANHRQAVAHAIAQRLPVSEAVRSDYEEARHAEAALGARTQSKDQDCSVA